MTSITPRRKKNFFKGNNQLLDITAQLQDVWLECQMNLLQASAFLFSSFCHAYIRLPFKLHFREHAKVYVERCCLLPELIHPSCRPLWEVITGFHFTVILSPLDQRQSSWTTFAGYNNLSSKKPQNIQTFRRSFIQLMVMWGHWFQINTSARKR